jgi:hypothetical protein
VIDKEIEEGFDKMVRLGILGRWWCERCEDWVPFKKLALDPVRDRVLTEAKSRSLHAAAQHSRD